MLLFIEDVVDDACAVVCVFCLLMLLRCWCSLFGVVTCWLLFGLVCGVVVVVVCCAVLMFDDVCCLCVCCLLWPCVAAVCYRCSLRLLVVWCGAVLSLVCGCR